MSAMRWRRALQLSGGLSSLLSHSHPSTPLLLSSQLCLATLTNSLASARSATPPNSFSTYSTSLREPWCPASVSTLRPESDFMYKIAASYSAKASELRPERNTYIHQRFLRTKRTVDGDDTKLSKKYRPHSGQDSFFVSQVSDIGSIAFGVVDGVGGWATHGIDPADFAHSLCDYMAMAANNYPADLPQGPLHPMELLQLGFQRVTDDATVHAGGSTACVGVLEPDGQLEVANLGDSGFVHFGPSSVRYVSDPQIHGFNTPYQLSKMSKRLRTQMSVFSENEMLKDLPKDSHISKHKLAHGDVLVFASDGVWDNLSPQDTLSIVSKNMLDVGAWTDENKVIRVSEDLVRQTGRESTRDYNTVQTKIARAVTKEAKEASRNSRRDGPFAREVQKWFPGENWHGGKPDDICVIVIVVVDNHIKAKL